MAKREWNLIQVSVGYRLEKLGRAGVPPEYVVRQRFGLEQDPARNLIAKYTPDEAERLAEQLIKYAAKVRALNEGRPRDAFRGDVAMPPGLRAYCPDCGVVAKVERID